MELHQLRYFVAVAEARHFTKAARGLRIAQPSVSRGIRVLEEELGTTLFHRMKGNVALTSAGEVLLPWARRVIADVDGAALEVRELGDLRRGRLAVGATPSLTTTLLPPALARFHERFAPKGTNVNFIQPTGERAIAVRTYERGVEAETLACGTGVVASALIFAATENVKGPIGVIARGGDELQVGFERIDKQFINVTLTGPAEYVFEGTVEV